MNNFDENDPFFLFFISVSIYSFDFYDVPAGESKINLFTWPGYFSQYKAAIYPPKLCPTSVKFLISTAFLHYSTASTK
jgi:hypothetical protein